MWGLSSVSAWVPLPWVDHPSRRMGDAVYVRLLQGVVGGNGGVREEAEAHAAKSRNRMVPRWSAQHESGMVTGEHVVHPIQPGAHRQTTDIVTAGRYHRIAVDVAAPRPPQFPSPPERSGGVVQPVNPAIHISLVNRGGLAPVEVVSPGGSLQRLQSCRSADREFSG